MMEGSEKIPNGWIKVKSKSRPDRFYFYNKESKLSVWKIEDCKELKSIVTANGQKTPKKSPTKLSEASKVIQKKNIAQDRLKKLEEKLKDEVKRGNEIFKNKSSSKPAKTSTPKKATSSEASKVVHKKNIARDRLKKLEESLKDEVKNNTEISENNTNKSAKTSTSKRVTFSDKIEFVDEKDPSKQIVPLPDENHSFKNESELKVDNESMEIDEVEKSQSSQEIEPMEWEEIDETVVVKEVHNVRTKENSQSSSLLPKHINSKIKSSQNEFYIIIDTNVLLSNLQFVKDIKGKIFKDIGRAVIFLPYVVLCELDRLKMREESIARLARFAITFIDECFKAKDSFMLGQSALESSHELIEVDSGDDYIINCALQIKQLTNKIIILSNDKNLRNKAFVNEFDAYSYDMLNYTDYNVANKIKFE